MIGMSRFIKYGSNALLVTPLPLFFYSNNLVMLLQLFITVIITSGLEKLLLKS